MYENSSEVLDKLIETELFTDFADFNLPNFKTFIRLKGTIFYYNVIFQDWDFIGNNIQLNQKSISFEYVLDHVEPEIQARLLFHLDLFR